AVVTTPVDLREQPAHRALVDRERERGDSRHRSSSQRTSRSRSGPAASSCSSSRRAAAPDRPRSWPRTGSSAGVLATGGVVALAGDAVAAGAAGLVALATS